MKRLPTFGTVRFYIVTEVVKEGEYPQWMTEYPSEIVLEEDLEDWKETVQSNVDVMPEFKYEPLVMRNRDFEQKYIFGCYDENYGGTVLDKDCPKCGHLLIEQAFGSSCSECDYGDEEYLKHEKDLEDSRNAPPLPRFREEGQTFEEFSKKYRFDLDRLSTRAGECARCKSTMNLKDFYRTSEYAAIEYVCPNCDNGAGVFIPQGKSAEEWARILS